jgi:hypothetical protein
MKLLVFVLIALIMGINAKAQQVFDWIKVDVRDLVYEVDYFTTETGNHTIYTDTTSFVTYYGPFTSFQNGYNLQVGFFALHFNADTSRISVWAQLNSHPYTQMDFFDVPFTMTSALFEIDLDSAAIAKSNLYYKTFENGVIRAGGRRWERNEIFKGTVLSTSRIRIIFHKGVPSEVDDDIQPMRSDVSPNPAYNRLKISSEATISEISLYDMLGRKVLATIIYGSAELDISSLEPGVYLLRTGDQVRKIIVE